MQGRRTHTKERPYDCNVCSQRFRETGHLQRHVRIHTGEKPHRCQLCPASFITTGALRVHLRTHTGGRPIRIQGQEQTLHRLIKMAEMKLDIEEPSLETPRNQTETAMKQEAAGTADDAETTGPQPKRRTKRKSLKTKKATIHHDCAVCGSRFKKRSNLKAHERVHSGERPYSCEWCSKSFSQLGNMEVHLRLHTGDKPFNCTYCNKSFASGSHLKVHARSHTKEQPYECNVCSKRFSQASHLQCHVRIHTGEKPFQCFVCDKGFKSSSQLNVHARTHTKERPYKLNCCPQPFNFDFNRTSVMLAVKVSGKPRTCNVISEFTPDRSHMSVYYVLHHSVESGAVDV
ncbi:unnamed protein product [Cyprideis torosa]|uniref:Uncharacterized protein n=1 Tax=Cyprideis torosa TaxID=163714 RepID=A0A7R8ZUQ4_9CRUS|nr:unnamed protein product [Cyprideis torosa]CAG0901233.1 unnamed protein product [Cyprideis torosa]